MTTTPNDAVGGRKMEEGLIRQSIATRGPQTAPLTTEADPSAAVEAKARALHAMACAARGIEPGWDGQMTNRSYWRRLARALLAAEGSASHLREVGEPDERAADEAGK